MTCDLTWTSALERRDTFHKHNIHNHTSIELFFESYLSLSGEETFKFGEKKYCNNYSSGIKFGIECIMTYLGLNV